MVESDILLKKTILFLRLPSKRLKSPMRRPSSQPLKLFIKENLWILFARMFLHPMTLKAASWNPTRRLQNLVCLCGFGSLNLGELSFVILCC